MTKKQIFNFISCLIFLVLIMLSFKYAKLNNYLLQTTFFGLFLSTLITAFVPDGIKGVVTYLASLYSKKRYYEKLLNQHEEDLKHMHPLNNEKHKAIFLRLYGNKEIDKEFLEKLDSLSSAAFLIGLQYYHKYLTFSKDLNSKDITNLSVKATKAHQFIRILTSKSLNTFWGKYKPDLLEEVIQEQSLIKVENIPSDSDKQFHNRLGNSINEKIFIFSTTSQISKMSLNLIEANAAKISELNLFLVSPLIKTDNALVKLNSEYEVPKFAFPSFQFLDDCDIDMLRRVLKILNAIQNTLDFANKTKIKVNLYLFTEAYPEIKIRLLESRSYLQIFPSSLHYANNLYRFGLEIKDKDSIDKVLNRIREVSKDSKKTRRVNLEVQEFNKLKRQALTEIYLYLLQRGYNMEKIECFYSDLRVLMGSEAEIFYKEFIEIGNQFESLIKMYSKADKEYVYDEAIRSDIITKDKNALVYFKNNLIHISVGVIFEQSDKILLIQKKKDPYTNKFSIVAGHLEQGESPYEGIKREIKEELGIEIKHLSLVRGNYYIPEDVCRYGVKGHLWFIFKCNEEIDVNQFECSKEEILEVSWFEKSELNCGKEFTTAAENILKRLGYIEDPCS